MFSFGAHSAEAVNKFMNPLEHPENIVSAIAVHEGWHERFSRNATRMVAVEANPHAVASLRSVEETWKKAGVDFIFKHGLAGTMDGGCFKLQQPGSSDHQLFHRSGRLHESLNQTCDSDHESVPMISASNLIRSHCSTNDTCLCAFDVEGSEFDIMRDLFIKTRVGCLCDVLVVEWHEFLESEKEYLLTADLVSSRLDFDSRFTSAAVLDSAMRFLLEDKTADCNVKYFGFRYDQEILDI